MSTELHLGGWRPSTATLVASILVVAGFLLTVIDWGFIAISAVAMFLPSILRELGVLRDKDEFQMEAARRAGYHAYLAGGLFAFLMAAWFRSAEPKVEFPGALLEDVLIVMWFTWLLSSLMAYWGARKTAVRILYIFGSVWLVFNIFAGEGHAVATVMQSLLAVPFFLAGWLASRWPRAIGILLLLVSVFFFTIFHLMRVFHEDPTQMGRIPVIVLFLGPLLASGIALLVRTSQQSAADRMTGEEELP